MPGAISFRTTRSTRGKTSNAPSKLPASSISSFARVSKLHQATGKGVAEKTSLLSNGRTSTIEIVLPSRKRKADDDTEVAPAANSNTPLKKLRLESEPAPVDTTTTTVSTPKKKKTVTFAPEVELEKSSQTPSTPSSRRKRRFDDENVPQPDLGCESLLERLRLQASPVSKRSKRTVTQQSRPDNGFELPQELLDLLDLQTALLKTLTMQYAHNGTTAPIDLRTIFPSVSRTWGKRQVTIDDIRLCIGIQDWSPVKASSSSRRCPFFLSDYGRGKTCIEMHPDAQTGPLREEKLNMDFEANLRTLWFGASRGEDQPVTIFISTLPKAVIKTSTSVAKASALFSKGQRTLEELKNGVVMRKQQQEQAAQEKKTGASIPTKPDGTKMSLLDRIRLKESEQAQLANKGPTPAELARRAALQRAEDVAAVIRMLCVAQGGVQAARMAFPMPTLLVKLKDSLRNAVSQEDGAACVRLLAAEVAPQWLRIVTVGGRENVVIQPAFQPTKAAVAERVAVLMG